MQFTKEKRKKMETIIKIFSAAFAAAVLASGCSHNIHVKGWGFASPCGAVGYGSFACVKDNTTVELSEKTPQAESKSKFVVGNQTTGYDVSGITVQKSCGQQCRPTPDLQEKMK